MNTPENQQQRSSALSSSKKTPLRGLKNVLVQPHEIFWPILREEEAKKELHTMLTQLLPAKKCRAKEMNWAKLCKLSKEKRSALKKDVQAKFSGENNDNVMTTVVLGINGVTKALEKNDICSILIDSNVEPLFMVKHIVAMGQNKSIPVLMVPFLKTVTLNKIGFACAALGIKRSVAEKRTEHFYELHGKIIGLLNTFGKEKSPLQSFATENEEMDSCTNYAPECSLKVSTVDKISDPVHDILVSQCVYKYRSSPKERVFIPPKLLPIEEEKMCTEFIALDNDEDDENMVLMDKTTRMFKRTGRYMDIHQSEDLLHENDKTSPNGEESDRAENVRPQTNIVRSVTVDNMQKSSYIPLKVKRIQGNPKRMKATKIAKTKKKDKIKK